MQSSPPHPPPAVALLDVDGTLLDSNDAHARSWVSTLQRHGHAVAYEAVRPLIGKGSDKLLEELLGLAAHDPKAKQLSDDRREHFLGQWLPGLRPTRGARQLLEGLRAAGLRLVVATSASDAELDALLRQAGVQELVDDATTSTDAEDSKPDPDIVEAALAKAGVEPARAVMLGDTPYDIEAAHAAGVRTVALRCGGWWGDADLARAAAIYDDPAHLLMHLADSPLRKGRAGSPPGSDPGTDIQRI
jgi:HAD superfamily hydrolase (TIGR01509 family)